MRESPVYSSDNFKVTTTFNDLPDDSGFTSFFLRTANTCMRAIGREQVCQGQSCY